MSTSCSCRQARRRGAAPCVLLGHPVASTFFGAVQRTIRGLHNPVGCDGCVVVFGYTNAHGDAELSAFLPRTLRGIRLLARPQPPAEGEAALLDDCSQLLQGRQALFRRLAWEQHRELFPAIPKAPPASAH